MRATDILKAIQTLNPMDDFIFTMNWRTDEAKFQFPGSMNDLGKHCLIIGNRHERETCLNTL